MLLHRPTISVNPNQADRSLLAWEETACLLCGRDDSQLLSESADPNPAEGPGLRFAIVQCRHCGFAYTNPRPTPNTIARFYPSHYPPHAPRGNHHRNRRPSRFWSWVLGRPCRERRGLLPWPEPGRLLDFGCGGGSYLQLMAELGWRVTGLDASPQVVRTIQENLGCDVLAGTLPHPNLTPGSFDVITLWQSLEHVHRPLDTLRAAYELLVPGGKIVIAVPNFDCLAAGWFGENWFGLDLPRHLSHFTANTLSQMLQVAGFRVESVRGMVHADWLRSSAIQAVASGAGGLVARALRWKMVSRVVEWGCYALGRSECLVAVAERPE